MCSISEVENDFLSETREDFVGLWALVWRIRNEVGEHDPEKIRAHSMSILRALLNDGVIKAGVPNDDGDFVEWCGSPEQIINRIEDEWHQLGREPDIGDIVWFTSIETTKEESQQ
jgi:hypothetical protein